MRAAVRTPFVDTRARDLTWTLEHPPIEPLAARTVRTGRASVELRVLGASHQVLAGTRGGAPERLLETVACLPGEDGHLPERVAAGGTSRYLFTSTVETLLPGEFASRVARLSEEVAAQPEGLVAAFPGDHLAVTAMAVLWPAPPAGGGVLSWRTWHAYPQSGELVTTTTSVALEPPPPRSRGQANG